MHSDIIQHITITIAWYNLTAGIVEDYQLGVTGQ